uniref:Uncharacterized protein n=1 Tax=Oryza punctata TaxID=4537 RepID=A0A0E0JXE5_ORYPU
MSKCMDTQVSDMLMVYRWLVQLYSIRCGGFQHWRSWSRVIEGVKVPNVMDLHGTGVVSLDYTLAHY